MRKCRWKEESAESTSKDGMTLWWVSDQATSISELNEVLLDRCLRVYMYGSALVQTIRDLLEHLLENSE